MFHPYRPYFELKAKYYVQLEVCTFYLFYVEDNYSSGLSCGVLDISVLGCLQVFHYPTR